MTGFAAAVLLGTLLLMLPVARTGPDGAPFVTALFIPVTLGFSLFINILELLVAFIQAYIFTMLTAVFTGIGMASHDDHGHTEHAAAH